MQNVIIIRAILLLPIKMEDQSQEKFIYRSDIKEWSQVLSRVVRHDQRQSGLLI